MSTNADSTATATHPPEQGTELATVGQRLLWSLDHIRGHTGALNCPAMCYFNGSLREDLLRQALESVVRSHVALRTTLVPGRPLRQSFGGDRAVPTLYYDLSHGEHELNDCIQRELRTRIDPTASPFRISLFALSPTKHVLLFNAHHVVTDLLSSGIIIQDIAEALSGRSATPNGGWDFAQYAAWERRQVALGAFAPQARYWWERLAGAPQWMPLPFGNSLRSPPSSDAVLETRIDAQTRERLVECARFNGVSEFAVLLAALFILMFQRTNTRDLAVSSLFATRQSAYLARTVGFLINLLVLRIRLPSEPTLSDVLKQCQSCIVGAIRNSDLPFHAISPPPRLRMTAGRRPEDFVFHVSPEPIERRFDAPDLTIESVVPRVVGRFATELSIVASGECFAVRLTYDPALLPTPIARRLITEYCESARHVAMSPTDKVLRTT